MQRREEIKRKKRMKDVRDKIWKEKTKIEYKEIHYNGKIEWQKDGEKHRYNFSWAIFAMREHVWRSFYVFVRNEKKIKNSKIRFRVSGIDQSARDIGSVKVRRRPRDTVFKKKVFVLKKEVFFYFFWPLELSWKSVRNCFKVSRCIKNKKKRVRILQ